MSALNHIKLLKKYGIRTLDEALHFIILAEHEGLTDEECTALYKAMGIRKEHDWVRVATRKLGMGIGKRYTGLNLIHHYHADIARHVGCPKQFHYLSKTGKSLFTKLMTLDKKA